LCSGGREQEVEFAEWDSLDFTDNVFHIRETAQFKAQGLRGARDSLAGFLDEGIERTLVPFHGPVDFPDGSG
jgi:hypothetical protein